MHPSRISIVLTVFILWFGHFLVDVMLGIWPVYKTVAQLDLAKVGLIGGLCAFIGEGMQIIFGPLSDRGYRKLLMLCGLSAATANSLFVYTDGYLSLFVLYLVTSIASGAFHPTAASMMGDISTKHRGLFISIFTCGGAMGMATSQILFMHVNEAFSGQVAWMALPALCLAFFAIFFLAGQKRRSTEDVDGRVNHFNPKALLQFFKNRHLCLLYFIQVCNATLLWGTMFLLPDLLMSREYETWLAFGGGHMMFILGGVVMMLPAGYLADRFSSRVVIMVASIVSMVLFYTLLISPMLSDEMTLVLLFGIGASIVVVNPVSLSLGVRLVPQQKGMVSAFLMGMVWCVSEGIGQGGGGLLTKLFDQDAPAKALAVLGILFLVEIYLSVLLPQEENEIVGKEIGVG